MRLWWRSPPLKMCQRAGTTVLNLKTKSAIMLTRVTLALITNITKKNPELHMISADVLTYMTMWRKCWKAIPSTS